MVELSKASEDKEIGFESWLDILKESGNVAIYKTLSVFSHRGVERKCCYLLYTTHDWIEVEGPF
uniref:Uncharacterized protein n=1 Tax=Timema poppense TaxID=170557 RepID=A0A7R9DQ73_TIMPO|nr:unnamed protein product [Timema poppensis]